MIVGCPEGIVRPIFILFLLLASSFGYIIVEALDYQNPTIRLHFPK